MIPTPLIQLKALDPQLYAKIEYLHPSGSLKHRSIPAFLMSLIKSGEIRQGQPIAIRSAGSAAVTVAWTGAQLGCPVYAVLPPTVSTQIVALIEWYGGKCHVQKPDAAKELMARFGKDGETYVLQQANESRMIDHYQPVANEILAELPTVAAITVGIGTGLSATGIGRAVQASGSGCRVYGTEPAEAAIASGKPWAPHHIPGLAPPIAQPLLDKNLLGGIVPIPSKLAWERARAVAQQCGLLLGPSSGCAVAAAEHLRREGIAGPIVAVCTGSMYEYLGVLPN